MSTTFSHPKSASDAPRAGIREAAAATLTYAALSVAMTWPLARGLARDVPADLGDPLLNAWILAWDARHLVAAATGHLGALREYWQANIFFPHPYALAYSEHLTAEALQILPVYALTANPLLCYNLLFLSTFVLSGLGAFLLARELSGSRVAAFVAGLAYGFAPYRFGTLGHVQVLSSAWMPFTLYALHRYFDGGRRRALAGSVAAFVAQALSCGYYLLFFAPVVALFVAWEIGRNGRWRDRRMWTELAIAAGACLAILVPFLLPYLAVRRAGVTARSIGESDRFAADVYAYFTADVQLRFWGRIARVWPRPEGSLFPGLTVSALAVWTIVTSWRAARVPARTHVVVKALVAGLFVATALGALLLLRGSVRFDIGPVLFKANSLDRVLLAIALLAALLLASRGTTGHDTSARPYARQLTAWLRTPAAIMTAIAIFAVAMSFGPHIHSRGRLVDDANVYLWFFQHVPGFDALRVPARFGMIVALALAMLAAQGIARLPRRYLAAAAAAVLVIAESWSAPILTNYVDPVFKHAGLTPIADPIARVPPIYDAVATLPADAVLLELPAGEPAFDVRAMFYSTRHWRRLVNGYSGSDPVEYGLMTEQLNDLFRSPDSAWDAVARSGATHLVVHEAAYAGDRGAKVVAWASAHGATELARAGADRLFAIKSPQ